MIHWDSDTMLRWLKWWYSLLGLPTTLRDLPYSEYSLETRFNRCYFMARRKHLIHHLLLKFIAVTLVI